MEQFSVTKTEAGFQIEGFPNAAKVIHLKGPKAKRLADLSLHINDLNFAMECLETINQVPDKPLVLKKALWRAGIIHYMKCFGDNKARSRLNPKTIYKGNSDALTAFNYFKNLRNKHYVHDENSFTQSIPGAILNKRDKPHKIEKIVCFNATGLTLNQVNYSNLHQLIQEVKQWAEKEYDNLCDIFTKELESRSYEELDSLESMTYTAPKLEEIKEKRNTS